MTCDISTSLWPSTRPSSMLERHSLTGLRNHRALDVRGEHSIPASLGRVPGHLPGCPTRPGPNIEGL